MTLTDAAAIAETLSLPTQAVIGGQITDAISAKTFASINPATGQELAQIAECGSADVDAAVAAARSAVDTGPWGAMAPADRRRLMIRFANLIDANAAELATLEALEGGKPIADTSSIDVPETVEAIRWHAEAADKVYDQISPSGPGVVSMIEREPLGVIGAVLPWNFPLMMAGWKLGPILATGNAVVLKPAEQTSMTTLRLAELALEAGLPAGVVNAVPGFGPAVGEPLGRHGHVDGVTFTGSTETGREFLRYSADSNLKRVTLECGGKNPLIVMADADNLDSIADHIATSIFWNAGQNCSSNSRLIVHSSLKAQLLDLVLERAGDWVVGDPLDPATKIGAIIEEAHMAKILDNIAAANEAGAELILGGNQVRADSGGWFVEPTIFDNVTPDMRLATEEVFGPVLAVTSFDQPDDAIELANRTEYGLAASIFTSDVRTAHLAARRIQAGTVTVNCYGEGDITTPFGGYKLSGFGGRDNGLAAHEQYTQPKTIWLDLS